MAKSLSKGVLQMKFMKKTALRHEKELNDGERKQQIDDEHWVLDLPELKGKKSRYLFEESLVTIEDLCYQRMSFGGFNPEIEKLMKEKNSETQLEISAKKEKEISVSDDEMAERYNALVGTISNKFAKKRDRSSLNKTDGDTEGDTSTPEVKKKKKKKFLKPVDD